ncbi:MAG: sigma-70 family RNA polymerase sigma factor [Bacteroidota bacterium]
MSLLEQNIIQALLRKEKRAIELIYDNYSDALYGIVFRIIKDEGIAQDVMQEGFIKVWKYAEKYDPKKAKLFTWLLQIFRNTALDKLRSIKSKGKHEIQTDNTLVYDNRRSHYNPDVMDIGKHLGSLEQKYVDVVDALFYKGMTQKEASEFLQLPIGTIKTRLKIALRELRKIFSEKEMILCYLFMMIM